MKYSRKLKSPKFWRERMVLDDYDKLEKDYSQLEQEYRNEVARINIKNNDIQRENDKLKNRINSLIQSQQEPQQTLAQYLESGFGGLMHAERKAVNL